MPVDIADKINQGIELMALERYEAAKHVFEEVVAADRRNLDAYLHLGNACISLGLIDEGIAQFKKALLVDEGSVDALYSLGCAYFLKEDKVNAIRYFNRVEELGAATVEMYAIMMVLFVDADDPEMAIRYANRAIQLDPLNASLRVDKAQIYLAVGRYGDAASTLRELQELLPDELEGYAVEVEVQLEAQDYDAAIAALNRALDRFPEDPRILVLKARTMNVIGRYEEALAVCDAVQESRYFNEDVQAETALQRGIALGGLDRMDESIAAIESTIGMGENPDQALFLIMNEALALQAYDKALEYADKLLAIEDVEPRVHASAVFAKPFALDKLGRAAEAQELYREAVSELRRTTISNPGLFEVYGYRVMCHKALGEYDKALEIADHIISLDEDDAAAYALKRDVLLAKGDESGAEAMRAKVLSLDPDFVFGEE